MEGKRNERLEAIKKKLQANFMDIFEYKQKVDSGNIIEKGMFEDDSVFQQKNPNHPMAFNNRSLRIAGADTLMKLSGEAPEEFEEELIDLLHKSLFDCCASVRHSIAITLKNLSRQESLPYLQRLLENETESKLARKEVEEAIELINNELKQVVSGDKDFYQNLRNRIRAYLDTDEGSKNKWSEYLLIAPDFLHLLCRLSFDKEVPAKEKAKVATAIAYYISPLDLVPEGLVGVVGYVDDVAVAAYVLNSIVNNVDPEIVRKHWAGEGDILEAIQHVLNVANEMVGSGAWAKIKRVFN